MPPKKRKDDLGSIGSQGVNDQLSQPEDDIADGYLEKREIHGELNSPAVKLLQESGPIMIEESESVNKETADFITRLMNLRPISKEEREKELAARMEQLKARGMTEEEISVGIVKEPWIDPVSAAAGGFAAPMKIGLEAGAKLMPTLIRSMTSAGTAALAEYPIGTVTAKVEKRFPVLAMPFSVIAGMISGVTIERAIERGVMKYFGKLGIKTPARKLVKESIERVKTKLESDKVDDEMTKTVQEELIGEVRKVQGKQVTEDLSKEAKGIIPEIDLDQPVRKAQIRVEDIRSKVKELLTMDDVEIPTVKRGEREIPFAGINLERTEGVAPGEFFKGIESLEDWQQFQAKFYTIVKEEIEQARGYKSQAVTAKLADMMGMTPEDLLAKPGGEAWKSSQEAHAARFLNVASADRLRYLAAKAKIGEATKEDLFQLEKQFTLHYGMLNQVVGSTAETARALNALKMTAKTMKGRLEQIDEFMKAAQTKGRTTEDLADMILSIDSIEGINTFVKQAHKATGWEMILEAWINGLVSGPQTHAVNLLSTALNTFFMIPDRYLAAGFGKVLPGPQEITVQEAKAMSFGMIQGFKKGLIAAGKTFITGEGLEQYQKADLRRFRAITAKNLDIDETSFFGRAIDLLAEFNPLWGGRLPTRLLGSEDSLFKAIGYEGELYARAWRQAYSKGLEGDEFAKEVMRVINDPPDDISAAAIDMGHYVAFTRELGKRGKAIQKVFSANPELRLIVPFFRTASNILKQMGERTPLALASKRVRLDLAAGGARRDLALAKMTLGSMIMLSTYELTTSGFITGHGPANRDLRRIKRNTGWQPYSLKVPERIAQKLKDLHIFQDYKGEGDYYLSYNRFEPLGMLMGVAASTAEIMGQIGEEERGTLALAATMAFMENTTSKTWLRGFSEALRAYENPDRYLEGFLRNYAKTFVPRAMAQLERTMDPTVRNIYDPRGFWIETYNAIRSQVWGWSDDLPPSRNRWAEIIAYDPALGPDIASPVYTSTGKYSPIDEELLRLKMPARIAKPTQTIHNETIALKPWEYDQFLVLENSIILPQTGMNLKKTLDNLVTKEFDYKQGDDDYKEDRIRAYMRQAREMAKEELYQRNKEVRTLVDTLQLERQRTMFQQKMSLKATQ